MSDLALPHVGGLLFQMVLWKYFPSHVSAPETRLAHSRRANECSAVEQEAQDQALKYLPSY